MFFSTWICGFHISHPMTPLSVSLSLFFSISLIYENFLSLFLPLGTAGNDLIPIIDRFVRGVEYKTNKDKYHQDYATIEVPFGRVRTSCLFHYEILINLFIY